MNPQEEFETLLRRVVENKNQYNILELNSAIHHLQTLLDRITKVNPSLSIENFDLIMIIHDKNIKEMNSLISQVHQAMS